MSRTTATFSVSLPQRMAAELERVRKIEHRTRSELVREALRRYMRDAAATALRARIDALPEAEPTADERRAIEIGLKEFSAGKHRTLSLIRHELHGQPKQSRRKRA